MAKSLRKTTFSRFILAMLVIIPSAYVASVYINKGELTKETLLDFKGNFSDNNGESVKDVDIKEKEEKSSTKEETTTKEERDNSSQEEMKSDCADLEEEVKKLKSELYDLERELKEKNKQIKELEK